MIFSVKKRKPVALIILDGWGIAPAWGGNAISEAKTKTYNKITASFPMTSLLASGQAVGLPTNAPGNSESGHLNIGAGRIVHQDISLIDNQIESGAFFSNHILLSAIDHAKGHNSSIHLMGLLSDVGIHSHIRHLYALLKLLKAKNFNNVYIHLFSDGRDSNPMKGIELISQVNAEIKKIGVGRILSISGRFFAMDRDNRWGRISRSYNAMVKAEGNVFPNPVAAISAAYASGQTDEFIEPRLIGNKSQPIKVISDNDSIILFNFRGDRSRELTNAFLADSIPEFPDREKLKNIFFATFSIYERSTMALKVFSTEQVNDPIAKVLCDNNLSQLHIAETEKYPHITYFLNGGVEKAFPKEDRLLISSPRNIKTYDLKPKMAANEITLSVMSALHKNKHDFYFINYANPDMVGHSGNFKATVHAVEFVDECLKTLLDKILSLNGLAIIVGDHGNAEQMVNPRTGNPDTEHTTNPVPFIIVSNNDKIKKIKLVSNGVLACVAPTILELMHIEKSKFMLNQSLIVHQSNNWLENYGK